MAYFYNISLYRVVFSFDPFPGIDVGGIPIFQHPASSSGGIMHMLSIFGVLWHCLFSQCKTFQQ
jgi:hypothetical protein